jgi:amino acid transporter
LLVAGGSAQTLDESKIGLIPCLAFAVGTMVGGGVFALSGIAIDDAGPGAVVSYILAGAVMMLSALSFVAVASRARPGDSGYGPVGDLLGSAWRFVTMWSFYLNGLMILTFLLISFGQYLNQYFIGGLGPVAAALIAALALAALNFGPAERVGRAETYVVGLKIAILLFFVFWGVAEIGGAHFSPFAPHGPRSIVAASALLFTAYTGFNVVTNMASSVRRPERTVPIAVLGSVLISGVIYVGVILAMLASGIPHYGAQGISAAATTLMGGWAGYLMAFAACLSTLSGANASMLGASDLMLGLAAQGDMPALAGRTTRRGHPLASVLLITVVTMTLVLIGSVDAIVRLANVAALVAMLVVNAAAFRLARRGWPGRGIRLPGGVTLPVLAAVTCLAQFPSLGWKPTAEGIVLIGAGLALYRRRSRTAALSRR